MDQINFCCDQSLQLSKFKIQPFNALKCVLMSMWPSCIGTCTELGCTQLAQWVMGSSDIIDGKFRYHPLVCFKDRRGKIEIFRCVQKCVIYRQPNKIMAYLTFHQWLVSVCNIHNDIWMVQTKTSHLGKVSYTVILLGWRIWWSSAGLLGLLVCCKYACVHSAAYFMCITQYIMAQWPVLVFYIAKVWLVLYNTCDRTFWNWKLYIRDFIKILECIHLLEMSN